MGTGKPAKHIAGIAKVITANANSTFFIEFLRPRTYAARQCAVVAGRTSKWRTRADDDFASEMTFYKPGGHHAG